MIFYHKDLRPAQNRQPQTRAKMPLLLPLNTKNQRRCLCRFVDAPSSSETFIYEKWCGCILLGLKSIWPLSAL